MSQWNVNDFFYTLIYIFFIGNPTTPWSRTLIWFTRITTISLLLRTYIAPWLLALTSKHIRIRSISLRSIKGLYFRGGRWTCRAERIGYVFGKVQGRKRLTIRIDGLKVEMNKTFKKTKDKRRTHMRNLTLADLDPSPLAGYLWCAFTKVALALEPWLRPLFRNTVVACLRIGIQLIRAVTQALSFELHSTMFALAEIPGTQVVADEINLHAELDLVQVESSAEDPYLGSGVRHAMEKKDAAPSSWTFSGMAGWKKKMSDGLKRALDRAWGTMHGTVRASFKLNDIVGTTTRHGQSGHESTKPFLRLPGIVVLDGRLNFSPQTASIDTNSISLGLKIDEIDIGVDLLNDILCIIVPPKQTSASNTMKTSLGSTTTLPVAPTSPRSLTEVAAVVPQLPQKRSRSSTLFSAAFLPMSPTAAFGSLEAKLLPSKASATPFLRAFSSSISSTGKLSFQPHRKLKDQRYKSILSTVNKVALQVTSVSLTFSSTTSHSIYYRTAIKDVDVDFHPSSTYTDSLHTQWLGQATKLECFDPESYGFQLRIATIMIERHKREDVFPLVTLDTLDFQAVVHQWPSPWLMPCMFIEGDPNAPFLTTSLKIGGLDIAERLDDLRDFLERRISKSKDPTSKPSLFTKIDGLQFPRCSIQIHCGVICARTICVNNHHQTSSTLEMRTNGLNLGMKAEYESHSAVTSEPLPFGIARLTGTFSFSLDPVLCHVRSGWASVGFSSDHEFLDDPPVLSIGAIEVRGDLGAEAEEELDVYRVKKASVFCDMHVIIDTVCVELWHADSVSATVQLLATLPSCPPSSSRGDEINVPVKPISLPSGMIASLALAKFIVVVTAPDINPQETDISRGIGLRAFILWEISNSEMRSDLRARSLEDLESRKLLGFPRERLVDLVAARSLDQPTASSVAVRLSVQNLVVRCAVATQYETDDPFLAGRDDFTPTDEEFIRIQSVKIDASLVASEGEENPQTACQVVIDIPSIRSNFQLGNIYCALLALQTIKDLAHVCSSVQSNPPKSRSSIIDISVDCRIQAFTLRWALHKQAVVSLLEDVYLTWFLDKPVQIQFKSLAFWVPPPIMVNPWEHDQGQKWDELLTFYQWDISLPVVDHSVSVAVKGESLRLRIPHGYVLADLIIDITVVAKAAKHLVQIVRSGMFTDMPAPESEGPNLSPSMVFDIQSFCIEVIDDPFESRLSAIWRIGLEAVKQRLEREEAFTAKLAVIQAAGDDSGTKVVVEGSHDYRFSARHTVSIEDARRRLDEVHFLDWKFRLQNMRNSWSKQESEILYRLYGPQAMSDRAQFPNSKIAVDTEVPPLFRLFIFSLNLSISLPSFPLDKMPDFLYEQGKGLPRDTEFSLLIPLHINFTLDSIRITIRDLPIPLLHVQRDSDSRKPTWTFDSDVVIAEEIGSDLSCDWVECPVLLENQGIYGSSPLFLHVPKTIMPVKSYACPIIDITTSCPTILSWGVSYNPVIQDIVRIIDTITPNSRDPSPAIGFWDKLRLIAHWKIRFSFEGEVRCYLKGSRDAVCTADAGAGFVLVWRGSPEWLIGYPNDEQELMQLTSEMMLIAIPRFGELASDGVFNLAQSVADPYQKICAELHSGVRYGVGFVFERTCDPYCKCSGNVFQRHCRNFSFVPHYDVRLENKPDRPSLKAENDSYREFRSDFIHFSFSLVASTQERYNTFNALHLTPKAFTHFWTWCSLFDSIPTLPIRTGSYYIPRIISPKFGRHIATIKYRIIVNKLFVMHGYIDDSHETWTRGITPWIGVKGMIDELRLDMHQRDQVTLALGTKSEKLKAIHHKPFYAAELILKGIDLRTVLTVFRESLKTEIPVATSSSSTCLGSNHLPKTPLSSSWYNVHDFIELDWTSTLEPTVHYLPFATCPRFSYVKRNDAKTGKKMNSKFGIEDTHFCLLEEEPSASQIQIALAIDRIDELKQDPIGNPSRQRMIALLEDYIAFLKSAKVEADQHHSERYHMPSEVALPEEWAEFDHAYQLHCPSLSLDKSTRDIMVQYYHSSRERKSFEYHLASRAVKFIRDQAKGKRATPNYNAEDSPPNSINTAASAIRKMLRGDDDKFSTDGDYQENLGLQTDPLDGWSDGVTLCKAHCCFLLKPQIVLKDEDSGKVCVVAAIQAKMQSFAIMDNVTIDDPISGKIMSRNYTSLSGFQTFSPIHITKPCRLRVPLEVLIDFRCESDEFECLVPQTDAKFHYDKFNRLRLCNQVASEPRVRPAVDTSVAHTHLQDEMDLIRVHIPHFTVSANDHHFKTISNIVTKLLLFSDTTQKARLEKLETLLFTYDFTDLCQAADVIVSLQGRLRAALETERMLENNSHPLSTEEDTKTGQLRLRAHILVLTEELNYLFDAIKLAQDRFDERTDQKSALLVHASSSELSWRMLGDDKDLLAKLVIQHSNFYWLNRQDSAMVNDLTIGNLQAFDGSRDAIWTEILLKHDEPASHPLRKRNLFLLAHWSIRPPVGGISIYEIFEVSLHPLKVQVDAKVGQRIMGYLLPDRRRRLQDDDDDDDKNSNSSHDTRDPSEPQLINLPNRSSLDSPRTLQHLHPDSAAHNDGLAPPRLRKSVGFRSFTDLRSTREDNRDSYLFPSTRSTSERSESPDVRANAPARIRIDSNQDDRQGGDAAVMMTRSSQKTFVLVKIASMNLVLSIVKEGSFECHDVRIKTKDLIYRNQTSSFEELVNQFIPSNMNWRGWMKMVFHQPLVPVFPMAKEILSKTKLLGSSRHGDPETGNSRSGKDAKKRSMSKFHLPSIGRSRSMQPKQTKKSGISPDVPVYFSQPLTSQPETLVADETGAIQSTQRSSFSVVSHPLNQPSPSI